MTVEVFVLHPFVIIEQDITAVYSTLGRPFLGLALLTIDYFLR